jgi:hypothetical protein
MEPRSLGLLVAFAGVAIVVIGLLIAVGALGWFGRLPGDIRFEGENTRVYVPIVSMVLVSVVLTVVLNVIRRLF